MRRGGALSWAQVLMAANTPMLLRAAMVDGRPDLGLMSSGQVAGLIEDLPSCAELIERVMAEAEARLAALAAYRLRPLQPLDDRHVGLAAALAHREQAAPVRRCAPGVQQRGEQPRAGRAERVAQGDRAAGSG